MNLPPEIDACDYIINDDYSDQPEIPDEFWIVYYQGINGKWFICLPSLYRENAIKYAFLLDRPTKILHYVFESSVSHTNKTKKVKKIRKVKQVV
jgi:hypothetical protein